MNQDAVQIARFTIHTVEIPMRFSVSHTLAERKTARNIIVCAHSENGLTGYGESCPRPYVTGETVESVEDTLIGDILPPMIGWRFEDIFEAAGMLTEAMKCIPRGSQAAFCAAELAVLDLAGKAFSVSTGDVLGPVSRSHLRYSGVIASGDPAKVKKYASLMRWFGFTEVKVKVKVGESLENNLEILRIVRSAAGDKMSIRIDANCAWSADQAITQLEAMRHLKLEGVEQPVAAEDYDGMTLVTAANITPVVADESLCSVADALRLIELNACDIFNIRISKCGGLLNSAHIRGIAARSHIQCQLGAQVGETAILSAAGRHIASRCGPLKWLEGSYGKILLKKDIAKPDMTIGYGGRARALKRPGIGVTILDDRLDAFKTDTIEVALQEAAV